MRRDADGKVLDIFDGLSQHISYGPESVRMLSDRCLIRDIGDAEKVESIVIPEMAREKNGALGKCGLLRLGVMVAIGPGDKMLEWVDPTGHGAEFGVEIRRRLIEKDGVPITVPPQCSVGDTVIYDRRKSEELYLDGQRYQLSHAEQAVLAVVEDDDEPPDSRTGVGASTPKEQAWSLSRQTTGRAGTDDNGVGVESN